MSPRRQNGVVAENGVVVVLINAVLNDAKYDKKFYIQYLDNENVYNRKYFFFK